MMDEAVLEQLLSEVAGEVPVPDGALQHVLDARDRWLPRRHPRLPALSRLPGVPALVAALRRYKFGVGAVAVLTAGIVTLAIAVPSGGGSGGFKGSAASGPAVTVPAPAPTAAGAAPAAAPAQNSTNGPVRGSAGAAATSESGGTASAPAVNEVPSSLPSKVIKTGTLSLRVGAGQLSPTVTRLSTEATAQGGFVTKSSLDTTPGSPASAEVTVEVPEADFESFLADAQKLGTTQSVTTSGQDVTSSYVDLQARIQSLKDARTQYEQILAHAQSIGDILSVESQITDLQTQIEQLQGQLNVLDNQTTYATLDVQLAQASTTVVPPKKAPAPGGLTRAWDHARHSFAHGSEAVLGALGGVAVFLIVVGILGLVGRLGWILVRRRLL